MNKSEIIKNPCFIKIIREYPHINTNLIIKDIYLSKALAFIKELFINLDITNYYLRGGTCLSKCYKETNRLSEDIDLTILGKNRTDARNKLKLIAEKLDELANKKEFEITFRDNYWNCSRNFLHAAISYEGVSFEIDIKSVEETNIINTVLKIQNKEVFDVFQKINKNYDDVFELPIINLELMVAEKMIGFHKHSNEINRRQYRHLYDIYMIFNFNLLNNNKETWTSIQRIYKLIVEELESKFNISTNIVDNSCFDIQMLLERENKQKIIKYLKDECYGKVEWNKIIDFYANLKQSLIS